MNNKITYQQIIDRLNENNFQYAVLKLAGDAAIIISQRGGRIFGPFLSQNAESMLWMNSSFADADVFKTFLESGDWNLGGDRFWIAPEIQYNVKDRTDFVGTYQLPSQVDPGRYVLDQTAANEYSLSQDMTLKAHNLASGEKQLRLERLIRRAEDPLRNLSNYKDLITEVVFAGYEQVVTLSESKLDDKMSEVWNLAQIKTGGLLCLCCTPCIEYTDYYEPVADLQTLHSNHVRLKITGEQMYKVGYKAAHLFGRYGYYNNLDDGQASLIVRNLFNNPSAPYAEEPAHTTGCSGHSVHVFNDDGQYGGFGELECNGQTIGGPTGKSSITDQMILWVYQGPDDKIKSIALNLLGVEI